jgi:general secretion pathway protein D
MMRRVAFALVFALTGIGASGQDSKPAATGSAPAAAASTAQAPVAGTATTQAPVSATTDKKPSPNAEQKKADNTKGVTTGEPVKAESLRERRKAAKLYLEGTQLLTKERPEDAWDRLKRAAELEPDNKIYARAAELARQSAVTQLVQQASRERAKGETQDSARLLLHAQEIDPKNPLVLQHLYDMGDLEASQEVGAMASEAPKADSTASGSLAAAMADSVQLIPSKEKHSFHLRTGMRQMVEEVFRAYGVDASVDEGVQAKPARLDLDDATFADAAHVLGMVTKTFYVPLDPHRVVVAVDNRENRTRFERLEMETIYLPGLTDKELTEVGNLAHNVFDAQQAVAEPTKGTLTVRASPRTLNAFNRTISGLEDGKNQLELDVKVIELAHVSSSETGTTFFQQTGVYNAFSEINSVLSQNQSLVQAVISQGLVPNSSTLTNQIEILAILVASGQLTGTPFNQGFLPFGGGLTQSIVSPSPATLTMSLNSSDTRVLDDIHMRLEDDEAGTFKIGERYPIETSSYSSVALPAIAGVSSAAASAESQTVPQIQYEDLGLTLKATPKVLRSNDVALTVDMKIVSLGGSSLNSIPILDNQQFAGVLTLREGETAVLVSDLSRTETRALSGMPGVGDIPGLEDISDIAKSQNMSRLLILVTPHVVREQGQLARGRMMRVDKGINSH